MSPTDSAPRPASRWHGLAGTDLGWGDYGDILVSGMVDRSGRDGEGRVHLERTGPFVPPITFPGIDAVVVTAEARRELEASGLRGFSFAPVVTARIVEYPWHEWDMTAPEPAEYPESGEPEDYVLGLPHDPQIAASMPELFELVVAEHPSGRELPGNRDAVRRGPQVLVSQRAKEWMEARWARWVEFVSADT